MPGRAINNGKIVHLIMFNPLKEKWLFAIATLVAGLPIWFTSYQAFSKARVVIISEVLTFLLAALFAYRTTGKNKIIFFTVAGGFISAIILKIVIDIFINPTDHNLWPFELILFLIAAFIFTGAGIGFGWGIRKIIDRDDLV